MMKKHGIPPGVGSDEMFMVCMKLCQKWGCGFSHLIVTPQPPLAIGVALQGGGGKIWHCINLAGKIWRKGIVPIFSTILRICTNFFHQIFTVQKKKKIGAFGAIELF